MTYLVLSQFDTSYPPATTLVVSTTGSTTLPLADMEPAVNAVMERYPEIARGVTHDGIDNGCLILNAADSKDDWRLRALLWLAERHARGELPGQPNNEDDEQARAQAAYDVEGLLTRLRTEIANENQPTPHGRRALPEGYKVIPGVGLVDEHGVSVF